MVDILFKIEYTVFGRQKTEIGFLALYRPAEGSETHCDICAAEVTAAENSASKCCQKGEEKYGTDEINKACDKGCRRGR